MLAALPDAGTDGGWIISATIATLPSNSADPALNMHVVQPNCD
jgi:hypothetical protein